MLMARLLFIMAIFLLREIVFFLVLKKFSRKFRKVI